jgi:hypothetical protein
MRKRWAFQWGAVRCCYGPTWPLRYPRRRPLISRKQRAGLDTRGQILLKLGRNIEHVVVHLTTVSDFLNIRLATSNGSFGVGVSHFSLAVNFVERRNQHSLFSLAGIKTNVWHRLRLANNLRALPCSKSALANGFNCPYPFSLEP